MAERTKPTALITGASGTIGRRLSERLRLEGWRVVGLSSRQPAAGPWERYVVADLAEPDSVSQVAASLVGENVPVIWHLAGKAHALAERGEDKAEYDRANVTGTRHVLALAQRLGVRRLVLASSVKAMGEGAVAVQDESAACAPLSAYGCSKLAAEHLVMAPGVAPEPVVLRFCMVYGGADRGNMGRMMAAMRRGRFPSFPETGNRRAFVYVDDAVQACLLAGTAPAAAGQTFLVTDGGLYSTRELYVAMRQALQLAPPAFSPPLWLFRVAARVGDVAGGVMGRRAPLDSATLAKLTDSAAYSSAKITRLLGYVPNWSLAKGLAEMAGPGTEQEEGE